jgi:MFS family permease
MTAISVADPPLSAWRRMRLWAAAHAVDDLYQGLVPACVPYFVLDRHYGYVAASGLTLAATLGAALPQLVVGFLVDRYALRWMAGIGVSLAGIGLGMSGVVPGYALVWIALFASGLGVAMFHPAAGKAARRAAGDRASAMSIFATGGNVGFFLAPVLATPALDAIGLGATVLFIPPAVLTGFVLLRHQQRAAPAKQATAAVGTDRWGPFLLLTAVEITRSVNFFGTSTFIELYWIAHLHASRPVAGVALTCFLTGGVVGTLLGGRLADRFGLTPNGPGGQRRGHPCPHRATRMSWRRPRPSRGTGSRRHGSYPVLCSGQARPGLPAQPPGHRRRRHARPRRQRRRAGGPCIRHRRRGLRHTSRIYAPVPAAGARRCAFTPTARTGNEVTGLPVAAQQGVIHPRRVRRGRARSPTGEPGPHRMLAGVTISVAIVDRPPDTVRVAFGAFY